MMFNWRRSVLLASVLAMSAGAAFAAEHGAGYFGYGATPTPDQIAGWAIAVRPDGQGLPAGHGSVSDGGDIYTQACAACHGTFGEGEGRYPKLAGTGSLTGGRPEPVVGNFWPYATTLFDYINRAMPFPAPHSLSSDQVYAVTAYVLNLNNLVPDDFVADKDSLPKVKMPNRHGFIWKDSRPDTNAEACMQDCRKSDEVKITSSAEGNHLTPRTSGPLDTSMPQ
ncbi:MAG: cytochrome c [Acetobacteraceae bacterium]|nr:cytochrome c [Acetobacteraceae bacterium]